MQPVQIASHGCMQNQGCAASVGIERGWTVRQRIWGGAIALGHLLGASGARLATTAVNQLHKSGGRYALCTMCIGVGQGIAVILERV